MRKSIFTLFLILVSMTMRISAQQKTTDFLQSKSKSGYKVSLQTKPNDLLTKKDIYPLSKEDAQLLIDILSTIKWGGRKTQQEDDLIGIPDERLIGHIWEGYSHCSHHYYITIVHPDKKKVTLRINSRGIGKQTYMIEYANGKRYGSFYPLSKLSDDDIKRIKQLFFKYNVNFNNAVYTQNEVIKIKPVFTVTVYHRLYTIELPVAAFDTAQTKQFIQLYNTCWNDNIVSGGGEPIAEWDLYDSYNIALYGDNVLAERFPDDLHLDSEGDVRQTLIDMANNALKGHNGEAEQIDKNETIHYQYKDGLLDGQLTICTPAGKLTSEFMYAKGEITAYVKYADDGTKEKEVRFSPNSRTLVWVEYDKQGNVKNSGESPYKALYRDGKEYQSIMDIMK